MPSHAAAAAVDKITSVASGLRGQNRPSSDTNDVYLSLGASFFVTNSIEEDGQTAGLCFR